jgi:hypothetical protein
VDPAQSGLQGKTVLDRIYRLPLANATREMLAHLAEGLISDFGTPVNHEISKFETPVDRIISLFETPENGLITKNATPVIAIISDLETHLKILESIKDSIKTIKNSNTPPDSTPSADPSLHPVGEDWHLERILEPVSANFRQEIMNDPKKAGLFKAWLVHNALNSRVNQPLNLALNKARQGAAPPDSAALRLASLPLGALIRLLEGVTNAAGDWGYRDDESGRNGARDLDLLLVGEAPNMQTLLVQRLLDLLG